MTALDNTCHYQCHLACAAQAIREKTVSPSPSRPAQHGTFGTLKEPPALVPDAPLVRGSLNDPPPWLRRVHVALLRTLPWRCTRSLPLDMRSKDDGPAIPTLRLINILMQVSDINMLGVRSLSTVDYNTEHHTIADYTGMDHTSPINGWKG